MIQRSTQFTRNAKPYWVSINFANLALSLDTREQNGFQLEGSKLGPLTEVTTEVQLFIQ